MLTLLPIVRDKVSDEKTRELLDVNIKNAQKIKNIINEALELARLENAIKNVDFKQLSLMGMVDDVLEDNKDLLEKNSFNVDVNIDSGLEVFANSFQLKEVFSNLLSNAVKYTPEDICGKIVIDAVLDHGFVKVSFSDNGQGLDVSEKNQIFDKFYKSGEVHRGMDSTGLGLSICKSIIDKHGGNIWVGSDGVGKGCTFYFTLKSSRGGS